MTSKDELFEHIELLEGHRYAAMQNGDLTALNAILDDDLIYIHSTGQQDTKQQYLELIESGTLAYNRVGRPLPKHKSIGEDVVLLNGRIELAITWDGRPKALDNVYILLWVRRPGGWRMLSWQSTARP